MQTLFQTPRCDSARPRFPGDTPAGRGHPSRCSVNPRSPRTQPGQPRVTHHRGVAAVEAFGHTQQHAEHLHDPLGVVVELRKLLALPSRQCLAVEQRRRGDDVDFGLIEAEQLRVLDEIVRVHAMVGKREKRADVVEHRGVFEQFAFPAAELVQLHRRGGVEEFERQTHDLAGVGLVEAAGPAELEHAAFTERVAVHDAARPARHVVDRQAVAEAPIRRPDLLDPQVLPQRVEHGRTGDDDVGARRVEPRHVATLLQRQRAEQPDGAFELLERHRRVAGCIRAAQAAGDLNEVEDRARAADHLVDLVGLQFLKRAHRDVADELLHLAVERGADRAGVVALEENRREPQGRRA